MTGEELERYADTHWVSIVYCFDIQVLLTTVDKDKLHTLANSLKKEDQNYDD